MPPSATVHTNAPVEYSAAHSVAPSHSGDTKPPPSGAAGDPSFLKETRLWPPLGIAANNCFHCKEDIANNIMYIYSFVVIEKQKSLNLLSN